MRVKIRLAEPKDAASFADIHRRSWIYAYSACVSMETIERIHTGRVEMWKKMLVQNPDMHYAVMLEDAVVGMVTVSAARDKDLPAGTGEMVGLYLDPDHIGRGVGRQVMDWVKAELRARGYTSAVLWVLDRNDRAKRFYERNGFAPEGGSKPSGLGDRLEERYILYF